MRLVRGVRQMMGTFLTVAVVHYDTEEAKRAVHAAFSEIKRVQDLMNIHDENSEVSVLNRKGCFRGISDDTRYVIERADRFARLSGGAFDITVLPLLKLLEEKEQAGAIPERDEIAGTKSLVGYSNIKIEDGSVEFLKSSMGITLAGAAKGYAVDRAVETLRKAGIRHALVNGGGDIRAAGGKTETAPWRVAVRGPFKKGFGSAFEFRDRAIATSGTYNRPRRDVIDPKTGRPAGELLSSTAITDNALDADILATCMFVMGVEGSREMLSGLEGVRAVLVTKDGERIDLD